MTRYFAQNTPRAGLEHMMMSVPGFQKRGGGMMILSRFCYKPEDVDCRYCLHYRRRSCQVRTCPYIAERLKSGAIEYLDLILEYFGHIPHAGLHKRIQAVEHWSGPDQAVLHTVSVHLRSRFADRVWDDAPPGYLVDGIVEVNPPVFVHPPVFSGQVCPAQDKGIQYLCFVGQGHECGGFKKEIGKPGKADRFFRLMDINGVCHIVFCGRLEVRFRRQTVVSIACPCSVLVKPCKSRTFQPLTVHTRPPFPFTFCFLPPVNSGGTVGTVFRPVGLWDEHSAADRTAF